MPQIFINGLQVNIVEDTSGIFSGHNVQMDWHHTQKINEGFGEVSGESNTVQGDLLIVGDQDIVDTFNHLRTRVK